MSSFSFKYVVFYIQELIFDKVEVYVIKKEIKFFRTALVLFNRTDIF